MVDTMDGEYQKLLSSILNKQHVDLSVFEKSYIKKITDKKAKELQKREIEDLDMFIQHINADFSSFYNSFFNSYSTFFRERISLDYLYYSLLPYILKIQRPLKVLSIGCSKGQEVYSMAILFENIMKEYSLSFAYEITGLDARAENISTAKKAIYNSLDIEQITRKDREQYFSKSNEGYSICSSIQENCNFHSYDIVLDKAITHMNNKFDIVICSNLMIYYKDDVKADILDTALHYLIDGGYFITSMAELEYVRQQNRVRTVAKGIPIFTKRVR